MSKQKKVIQALVNVETANWLQSKANSNGTSVSAIVSIILENVRKNEPDSKQTLLGF